MTIRVSDVLGASALLVLSASGLALAQDDPAISELWLHRSLMAVIDEPDTELAPFTTDGCSGGMSGVWTTIAGVFPEFVEIHGSNPPWEVCCVVHDEAYHAVGHATDAISSQSARLIADRALQACVADAAPEQFDRLGTQYDLTEDEIASLYGLLAESMFHAVRIGGAPCTGLPWRWGYGYPHCSPFGP